MTFNTTLENTLVPQVLAQTNSTTGTGTSSDGWTLISCSTTCK